VPKEIAAEIPTVAAKLEQTEQKLIDLCRSSDFSVDKLRQVIGELG
jgi:hypothetical protein